MPNQKVWTPHYKNVAGIALASAARTATVSSVDILNDLAKGVHIVLDVTAVADTPSVVLKIEAKDPASGGYYTLLTGAAVTTVSTNIYKVYPGLTASVNAIVSDVVPKTFRVTLTHADTDSITYSVGYSLV